MASRLRSSSGEKPDMRLLPTLCTYIYGVGNKQGNPSRVTVRSECGVVSLLVNKTSIPWEGAPWPMAPINVDSEWMLIVHMNFVFIKPNRTPSGKGDLNARKHISLSFHK